VSDHSPAAGSAAQPIRCDHSKTATESCLRCDPLNLTLWGHLPLATKTAAHHTRKTFGWDGVDPDTCMCQCSRCWDGSGWGCCLCPDCKNTHHNHSRREAESA
jgi:hypothetical protein